MFSLRTPCLRLCSALLLLAGCSAGSATSSNVDEGASGATHAALVTCPGTLVYGCISGKCSCMENPEDCDGAEDCDPPLTCTQGAERCVSGRAQVCTSSGAWSANGKSCLSKVVVSSTSSYLLSNLTVSSWGRGLEGELGDGTTTPQSDVQSQVVSLAGRVADIAAAGQNACAILVDGTVWCWGSSGNGMLGDGIDGTAAHGTPVQIPGLVNVTQIALGGDYDAATSNIQPTHGCALSAGSVWCWGDNLFGEIGVGVFGGTFKPTRVASLPAVAQIAVGDDYSCALIAADGTVRCWGANFDGELGNPTAAGAVPTPVVVTGLVATQITIGRFSNCAVRASDGRYACWGDDDAGELGNGLSGTGLDYATPIVPTPLTNMTTVALGDNHSCGILNGAVECWGDNAYGSLGNGSTTPSLAPVAAVGLGVGATSVSVGPKHVCAIASGTVYCWGANEQGQLGIGTVSTTPSTTPQKVL